MTMNPQRPAIEVRGLRKSFAGTPVLASLDLTVERGTVFALLGPNGAGKTTLISILSTLVAPDGGTAIVDGHDVAKQPGAVRRTIGLTGQSAASSPLSCGRTRHAPDPLTYRSGSRPGPRSGPSAAKDG